MLFAGYCSAGQLTYQFINPDFGGNPLNGSVLLNEAQAQNSYKSPDYDDSSSASSTSDLSYFTSAIQSQLLGNLMSNVSQGKPGKLVTPDFIVNVTNTDGQLVMNITDRKTNQTSQVEISGLSN
ncbi:curli assembly protein CsgF [Scandinavium sp. H11S7]|uniref:Curli production assembly/transport component CsgF n=1 Tax=Scandinavium hiltneri TaxID=2926519 RepID=A0ABT2E6Q2_9ENTR|nr:curli assembly protein CsgF [Scandinavium hiltneri]MCS2163093.1 curli assembly protein CsgF [Scandinavium hiltneri]